MFGRKKRKRQGALIPELMRRGANNIRWKPMSDALGDSRQETVVTMRDGSVYSVRGPDHAAAMELVLAALDARDTWSHTCTRADLAGL